MQFIPTQQNLTAQQRKLLDLFASLDQQNRNSLLAFAEFLAGRAQTTAMDEATQALPAELKPIPRPESESVVKAIKRLSATYHMLRREDLLDETSSLMTAHVMRGRDAVLVINDLEMLFERHYLQYQKKG